MRLVKGVHLVTGPLGGNVYLLKVGNDFILIDAALPRNDSYIFKYIGRFDKNPTDLKLLILTHCHLDHVGSSSIIVEKSRAKVCVHRDEVDYIEGRRELPVPNIKGLKGFSVRYSMRPARYKPVRVEHKLVDSQMVGPLETIELPGHSPGSIGLYHKEQDMLFCGDAMTTFNDNLCGPPEEFDMDMDAVRRSVQRIAELAPLYLCPGHGPVLRVEDDSLWDSFCDDMGVRRNRPLKKKTMATGPEKVEV